MSQDFGQIRGRFLEIEIETERSFADSLPEKSGDKRTQRKTEFFGHLFGLKLGFRINFNIDDSGVHRKKYILCIDICKVIKSVVEKGEKIKKLEGDLKRAEAGLRHMAEEYAATRGGSAYGVEYYDVQTKVYQRMVEDIKEEIVRLKQTRLD